MLIICIHYKFANTRDLKNKNWPFQQKPASSIKFFIYFAVLKLNLTSLLVLNLF